MRQRTKTMRPDCIYMSIKDYMQKTGFGRQTVVRYIEDGRLTIYQPKPGGRLLIELACEMPNRPDASSYRLREAAERLAAVNNPQPYIHSR